MISDIFYIGDNSTGTLDILDGGTVVSGDGRIGQRPTGVGTVRVDGLGSSWQANSIDVGRNGSGSLSITNQAQVISDTSMDLGRSANAASGILLVDGGGTRLSVSDALTMGNSGRGEMTISNGAVVTSEQGYIARGTGSSGSVLVTNAGSRWDTSLYILWVITAIKPR